MTDATIEKTLGKELLAWMEAHGQVAIGDHSIWASFRSKPMDGVYWQGYQSRFTLAVNDLPLAALDGTKLAKASGLHVASADAEVVAELVDRTGTRLSWLKLWPAAHPDAVALLDGCAKKLGTLELHPPHTSAVQRVRAAEYVTLHGATPEEILTAYGIAGLKRLTVVADVLPIRQLLDLFDPKKPVGGPNLTMDRHHLRIQADALGETAGVVLPKTMKALQIVGPGRVTVEQLLPLAATVPVLELDGVTVEGDVAELVHNKMTALRLRNVELSQTPGSLAKARKLAVVDCTGTTVDLDVKDGVRVVRVETSPGVPLPETSAFEALASAPASTRSRVLLAWGEQLARDFQTLLAFEPTQQGPVGKLAKATKRTHWMERLWEAIAPMFNICHEYRTQVRRTDHRKAMQELGRPLYGILRELDTSWQSKETDATWLAWLAGQVAVVAFAARAWDDEKGACPKGLDATGVVASLEGLVGASEPLPFPELEGIGFETGALLATRWAGRAVTSVLLELPKRTATKLRGLRNRAYIGEVGAVMAEMPAVLKGSPRAEALGQAITDVAADLQARESSALRRFAKQLRALYDGDEAAAQELDRRETSRSKRLQWAEIDEEARYVAWCRAVALHAENPPDFSDAGRLPKTPVLGRAGGPWDHQLAFWMDLLTSSAPGRERNSVALLVGRHMAEWVGGNPFANVPRRIYVDDLEPLGGYQLSDDLPKHLEWDAIDPLCDRWAVRLVDVVLARFDDAGLQEVRAHAMAGSTNRMLTRWPMFNGVNEPVVDFWVRAYEALERMRTEHPGDDVLPVVSQAFRELASCSLDPDDDQNWLSSLAVAQQRVADVGWEVLDAELKAALEGNPPAWPR